MKKKVIQQFIKSDVQNPFWKESDHEMDKEKLDIDKNLQIFFFRSKFSLAPTYQIPESDKISLKYILDWVWWLKASEMYAPYVE